MPINFTMDVTTLIATFGVTAGLGTFGIAVARIRGRNNINNSNGKLNSGKVMGIVDSKLKEFWEGQCSSEREGQEKLLVIHQKMYRVELKAATDVLHGEVEAIKMLLEGGLERIDERITRLKPAPRRRRRKSGLAKIVNNT